MTRPRNVAVFSDIRLATPVHLRDAVHRILLLLIVLSPCAAFAQDAGAAQQEGVRQNSGEFDGKLSAAGERTYATPPPLVGRDQSGGRTQNSRYGMVFLAYSF